MYHKTNWGHISIMAGVRDILYSLPLVISTLAILFRWIFARFVTKPAKFSDEKVTTTITTQVSIIEVKVTLPSRVIFRDETMGIEYDPSELVQLPKIRLGEGILGPLFKVVLDSGSIIKIRKLRGDLVKSNDIDHWMNFFGRIRDPYLSPVLFSFWYGVQAFTVYDYTCLGSLEELLHGREGIQFTPLNWGVRYNIALCTATAVASLHARVTEKGEALVCGVIKPSNVLIRIDFSACLSGYETPYLVSPATIIRRNNSRVAPELVHSQSCCYMFTQKSDVYSFGILLLELITGKKPMVSDEHEELHLVEYVKCKRKRVVLQSVYDERMIDINDSVGNMVEIAGLCLVQNPNERPAMDTVVEMIQQLQC